MTLKEMNLELNALESKENKTDEDQKRIDALNSILDQDIEGIRMEDADESENQEQKEEVKPEKKGIIAKWKGMSMKRKVLTIAGIVLSAGAVGAVGAVAVTKAKGKKATTNEVYLSGQATYPELPVEETLVPKGELDTLTDGEWDYVDALQEQQDEQTEPQEVETETI